ncbi:MAG: cupredoxin domain-containing protein [Candidatus Longimicrobiales bacterium M2_2A_002]
MTSETRIRTSNLKRAIFALLLAVVGGLTAYLVGPWSAVELPAPDPDVIDVAIDMKGFDTPEIRVRAGEPVTLRLTSLDGPFHLDGGGKHQLAIDEFGVNIIAPARDTASATFTPMEPGTYEFYCDICCGGRANPTMIGSLVVEEA